MMNPDSPNKSFRFACGFLILASFIGCDQATKALATKNLKGRPPQSYIADTFRLEYALNPGGFLSLGGTLTPALRKTLFVGFNVCFLIGVITLLILHWKMRLALFVAALCILAGGIGNLIDRIANQGLVTDFLVVGIGPVRSGIFNVADMGVTFGGIAVLLLARDEKLARDQKLSRPTCDSQPRDGLTPPGPHEGDSSF